MSPIDDLTYDVITVLQRKAKALEAYDKYVSDAEADDDDELRDMFESMRRQEVEHVQVLKEVLAQRLVEDLGYDEEEEDEEYEDEEEEEEEPDAVRAADVDDAASAGEEEIDAVRGAGPGEPLRRRDEPSFRQR